MAAAEAGSLSLLKRALTACLGGHVRWEVGDGAGNNFYITLKENGEAYRSLREVHGKWSYVNGEAQIRWDDGAQDAIRRSGSSFQKFAYSAGKSFTDVPDNVTEAHNTSPRPI